MSAAYRRWMRENPKDYFIAHRRGLLPKIKELLGKASINGLTKEMCIEEAKKYEYRSKWQEGSPMTYRATMKFGWMRACCEHMKERVKWTKEACIADAQKFPSYNNWRRASWTAYEAARKHGLLDEIKLLYPD
jgi:hypothetical protein